jgi:sec-independent protein translocase protein TatA
MFNLGPQELFWLFLIVLFIFGAKRIPEIGRSIGKGIQEFKKGMKEIDSEITPTDSKSASESPTQEIRKP